MDLRSSNKAPEKPTPRIRLSLTRSVGAELEHSGRRCRVGGGSLEKRKNRHYTPKPLDNAEHPRQRTPTLKKETVEDEKAEEWEAGKQEEEEEGEENQKKKRRMTEKDEEKTTDKRHEVRSEATENDDSTAEQEVFITPEKDDCQDLNSDWDAAETSPPEATDKSAGCTITDPHMEEEPLLNTSMQLQDDTKTDRSLENSPETLPAAPKGGGMISKVQNRASVITLWSRETGHEDVSPSAEKTETDEEEVAAECTTTLQLSAEVRTDPSEASGSPQHPGKVIVTDVTINSLTVTFKEAMTAEGFFRDYGLQI